MNGGVGLTGQSPWAAWMSVWHRPAVSTLTRTSPGPGSGFGTSSRLRGLVKSWTTAAFMDCLLCYLGADQGTGRLCANGPCAPSDRAEHCHSRIHTDLIWVYRLRTSWPISRPPPDPLYPRKGGAACNML